LRRLTGQNWLIKYRRPIGLFAFFYVCLHVTTLVWIQHRFVWADIVADVFEHRYMFVGFVAFLSLIPLAITSTRGWIRRLGKNWTKLHRLVYVAAIAGTVHYLWAVKKDTTAPLTYLAIFVALLGYRVWVWFVNRTKRQAAALPSGGARRQPVAE
jgi:sulfoxide reductase heme-binding subunit YedZ